MVENHILGFIHSNRSLHSGGPPHFFKVEQRGVRLVHQVVVFWHEKDKLDHSTGRYVDFCENIHIFKGAKTTKVVFWGTQSSSTPMGGVMQILV